MCHEDAHCTTDRDRTPQPDGLTVHYVVRGVAVVLIAVLSVLAAIVLTKGWNTHDLRLVMCGCALGLLAGMSATIAVSAHGTIIRTRNEHALYDSLRTYLLRVLGRTDDLEVGEQQIVRSFREANDARVARIEGHK